jgi:hypothetical protein
LPQPRAPQKPSPEPPRSREEQLAREAGYRPRAGVFGVGSAVLLLAGGVAAAAVYSSRPADNPGAPLLLVKFIHDKATGVIASSIVLALGFAAMVPPLLALYDAAKYRRPELPPAARVCAVLGPLAYGLAYIAIQIVVVAKSGDVVKHFPDNYFKAHDALSPKAASAIGGLQLAGTLATGFAFVMISLNAMRVGLLTRFMGVLGIIVGALFVIPLGSPLPIVQAFWLGAVGILLLDRLPGGTPPTWQSAKPEPWPTQQEIREQRERAQGRAPAKPQRPSPDPTDPDSPHPTSRKRKRKKKR